MPVWNIIIMFSIFWFLSSTALSALLFAQFTQSRFARFQVWKFVHLFLKNAVLSHTAAVCMELVREPPIHKKMKKKGEEETLVYVRCTSERLCSVAEHIHGFCYSSVNNHHLAGFWLQHLPQAAMFSLNVKVEYHEPWPASSLGHGSSVPGHRVQENLFKWDTNTHGGPCLSAARLGSHLSNGLDFGVKHARVTARSP